RHISDLAADVHLLLDARGRLTYSNRAATMQLGYSPEELAALNAMELTPEELRSLLPDQWRQARRGDGHFETTVRRKAGTTFPADVGVPMLPLQGQDYAFVVLRDIRERKAAEDILRRSEQRLQAILDNSGTVIYLKDQDGRYLFVNRHWEAMFHGVKHAVI